MGVMLLRAEMDGLSYKSGYETAWDDVSNAALVPTLVREARELEMEYFRKLGVYERVPRSHQVHTGGKIIGVRWVDVNKGDATDTNYRSRLVGREFNVGRDDALYAATPPLEALRVVISHAATHTQKGNRRSVMVNDVRRAYFYAKIQRDVYIELPQEDEMHGKMLGKPKLCLYGTRDAAKGWQETLSAHLEAIGFERVGVIRASSITRAETSKHWCMATTMSQPVMTRPWIGWKPNLPRRTKSKRKGLEETRGRRRKARSLTGS